MSGENKSIVGFKLGTLNVELGLPMNTPTTPGANPDAAVGAGKIKAGSDGEISLIGAEVTPEGKGVGGGVDIMANSEALKTAVTNFIPAVVGGVGEIPSGTIHDPTTPQRPLVPMSTPEGDR